METFTRQKFVNLAEVTEPACISILMPTHPTGRENTQDPIRFKNLLKEAEQALVDRGERSSDARGRLDPLREFSEDTTFWAHQREGLAAFALASGCHVFSVPFSLRERAVVGSKCYLLPLISTLNEDARFYVLAVSPKKVRLFEATRYSHRQLELPGWPEDFEELSAYVEEEAYLQFHTGAAPMGTRGDRAASFHGHAAGDSESVKKQRLLEYCQLLDRRMRSAIQVDQRIPMVLACDERLAPIYRSASEYDHIVDEPITGNPDEKSGKELCEQAWKILEPQVTRGREEAISRYGQAVGNNLAAKRLDAVLAAAQDGRIDTLLVAGDTESWGKYDPDERRLDLHQSPAPHDEELLNLAALFAHLQGAEVYSFPQRDLPDPEPVLAVLRF